jgi:hypothetical protein
MLFGGLLTFALACSVMVLSSSMRATLVTPFAAFGEKLKHAQLNSSYCWCSVVHIECCCERTSVEMVEE